MHPERISKLCRKLEGINQRLNKDYDEYDHITLRIAEHYNNIELLRQDRSRVRHTKTDIYSSTLKMEVIIQHNDINK